MNNWNSGGRPDKHFSQNIVSAYQYSRAAKLNEGFDKFINKIGGKGRVILLLLCAFIVIISTVAFLLHTAQQQRQFTFGGNTFSLVSIDRASQRNMILEDRHGNILTFEAPGRVSYLNYTFSVFRGGLENTRNYTFSDGSRGNNSMNQRPGTIMRNPGEFPVGRVPHFNEMQQAESVALAMFADFYENYTETHVFVLAVIGSSILWFFCLLGTFFREGFHETFRPFKRVWQAEMIDQRLAELDGKVSVTALIVEFAIVVILAVIVMTVFPWW